MLNKYMFYNFIRSLRVFSSYTSLVVFFRPFHSTKSITRTREKQVSCNHFRQAKLNMHACMHRLKIIVPSGRVYLERYQEKSQSRTRFYFFTYRRVILIARHISSIGRKNIGDFRKY